MEEMKCKICGDVLKFLKVDFTDIVNSKKDMLDVPIRVEFYCKSCDMVNWIETHIPECCEIPKVIDRGTYKMDLPGKINAGVLHDK